MAGPAGSDVPDRYDVVFSLNDGTTYGFLYADSVESNLPFRTHKALYSYSPTFLERQNLSNTYGDNFQDFFLTATQADFSEGEQQKFFRINDPDSVRKYWRGSNVDPVTVPGNTTLTQSLTSLSGLSTVTQWTGSTIDLSTKQNASTYSWYGVDSTNLYGVKNNSGTWTKTTIGAHGMTVTGTMLVGTPAADSSNIYMCCAGFTSGIPNGSGEIRQWNGTSFSTFSTTHAYGLTFLNNILYGYQQDTDSLLSFDTSGNPTTQFQWKNADGTNSKKFTVKLLPYGGQLYILRQRQAAELWVYDGAGCRKLADFPVDFNYADACVSDGIVFVSGYTNGPLNVGTYLPQVYYYANGSIGKLWESKLAPTTSANAGSITPYGNGVVFQDPISNDILWYDVAVGGVRTMQTASAATSLVTTNDVSAFLLPGSNQVYPPTATNYNSSGNIQTSQYDFDNTLTKVFRAIKIDADIPANTSVDIAYQLDGAGGTYTSLKTGAASGTEYTLPANTTGRSISVKVTLNSATGSATPTLKHVYVRAAPILQQFRRREYLFDISGGSRDELGKSSRRTRDFTAYPKDPITACNDLVKIATQTIPFTVYDRFTTSGMTCLADLQQNSAGYDGFALYEVRPNVFIGRINLREV